MLIDSLKTRNRGGPRRTGAGVARNAAARPRRDRREPHTRRQPSRAPHCQRHGSRGLVHCVELEWLPWLASRATPQYFILVGSTEAAGKRPTLELFGRQSSTTNPSARSAPSL